MQPFFYSRQVRKMLCKSFVQRKWDYSQIFTLGGSFVIHHLHHQTTFHICYTFPCPIFVCCWCVLFVCENFHRIFHICPKKKWFSFVKKFKYMQISAKHRLMNTLSMCIHAANVSQLISAKNTMKNSSRMKNLERKIKSFAFFVHFLFEKKWNFSKFLLRRVFNKKRPLLCVSISNAKKNIVWKRMKWKQKNVFELLYENIYYLSERNSRIVW